MRTAAPESALGLPAQLQPLRRQLLSAIHPADWESTTLLLAQIALARTPIEFFLWAPHSPALL